MLINKIKMKMEMDFKLIFNKLNLYRKINNLLLLINKMLKLKFNLMKN